MIPDALIHNTATWAAQTLILTSTAALLPMILRVRHPKSRLMYCHVVLAACVVLPLIQPWQQSLVLLRAPLTHPAPLPSHASVPLTTMVFWIILAGAAVRVGWLSLGLHRIRRYKRSSILMHQVPDSIRSARRLAGSDASFRFCEGLRSPATLGHTDPIVLLPPSFADLDGDAQRAIAVHELLHVRRNDWAVTVAEELAAGLLWFSPGVWWLLAQARLSREQLVDAEVIRLTALQAPYVHALLSMAETPAGRVPAPAAFLFSGKHLGQRLVSLLSARQTTGVRITASYAGITFLLMLTVLGAFVWLPMRAPAEPLLLATTLAAPMPQATEPFRLPPVYFDVRVPAPPLPAPETLPLAAQAPQTRNVFFLRTFVPENSSDSGNAAPRLLSGFAAIRAIRPGDVLSPEEIRRIVATIPPGQTVHITQDSMNTVTKVVIGFAPMRSTDHDASAVPSSVPGDAVHTESAVHDAAVEGID